jgi:hypothetical protein
MLHITLQNAPEESAERLKEPILDVCGRHGFSYNEICLVFGREFAICGATPNGNTVVVTVDHRFQNRIWPKQNRKKFARALTSAIKKNGGWRHGVAIEIVYHWPDDVMNHLSGPR